MRRRLAVLLLVLAVPPAGTAADLDVAGTLAIDEDLVVGPGDTVRLRPGALVTGPGRLVVHGRVLAEGTPEAPVRFTTGIRLAPNATADLVDIRFLGVAGAAVEADRAEVRLVRAVFDGGDDGLRSRGGVARVHGARATGLTGAAFALDGNGTLEIDEAVVRDSGVAVSAAPRERSRLRVTNSTFVANTRDVDVEVFGPGGDVLLLRNAFAASSGAPSWQAASGNVRVHGDGALAVRLEANRFDRTPLALRLEGSGHDVLAHADRFDDCGAVAVVTGQARVRFEDALARCEEGAFVSGGAIVVGVRRSAASPPGGVSSTWIGIGGAIGAALALGAGWAFATREGRRSLAGAGRPAVREAVLAALSARHEATAAELAQAARARLPDVERALEGLARDGEVEALGEVVARWRRRGGEPPLRRMERVVLDEIRARPGRAQAEIAEALGLSRQALHYHVKKLERSGLVVKVTRGRETLCFPAGEGMPPSGRDLS